MLAASQSHDTRAQRLCKARRHPRLPRSAARGIVPGHASLLTPEELFRRLDALGIAHRTVTHPPVFTVAEAAAARHICRAAIARAFSSRTRRAASGSRHARGAPPRSQQAGRHLGAPRFSFGAADDLYALLGVRPGSVTPFALVNDTAHRVTPVLDRAMLDHDPLNYHPLANDRTTAIGPADLLRFIAACGHRPRIVDLPGFERQRLPDCRRRVPRRPERLSSPRRTAMLWGKPERGERCRANL